MATRPVSVCPACGGQMLGDWADDEETMPTGVWTCEACVLASGVHDDGEQSLHRPPPALELVEGTGRQRRAITIDRRELDGFVRFWVSVPFDVSELRDVPPLGPHGDHRAAARAAAAIKRARERRDSGDVDHP